jgi:hypothetical protein
MMLVATSLFGKMALLLTSIYFFEIKMLCCFITRFVFKVPSAYAYLMLISN